MLVLLPFARRVVTHASVRVLLLAAAHTGCIQDDVAPATQSDAGPDFVPAFCGDGLAEGPEKCDDGNDRYGDGCASCQVEPDWSCDMNQCTTRCGDSLVLGPETCDDGGAVDGDGCSRTCQVEVGWNCSTTAASFGLLRGSTCKPACGDGKALEGEACDDGNMVRGDGCDLCRVETCIADLCSVKALDGAPCRAAAHCASGSCNAATFRCGQSPNQGACATHQNCSAGSYCDPFQRVCLARKADASACNDSGECASRTCTGGYCGGTRPQGAMCSTAEECASTACTSPLWGPSRCGPLSSVLDACTTHAECVTNYCDDAGLCRVKSGDTCNPSSCSSRECGSCASGCTYRSCSGTGCGSGGRQAYCS